MVAKEGWILAGALGLLLLVAGRPPAAAGGGKPPRPPTSAFAWNGPVLVYGDSQAGGLGREIADRLSARGLSVTRISHSGDGVRSLTGDFPGGRYGTVVILAGDNDDPRLPDVSGLVSAARATGGRVYWISPPPLTYIGDPVRGERVWGSGARDRDYWSNRGLAQGRIAFVTRLDAAVTAAGAEFVRLDRMELSDAVPQPSGVSWPTLADGLHVTGVPAEEVAAILVP